MSDFEKEPYEQRAVVTRLLPGQLLARHMVLERGRDPDRPRGLQKVTR